MFIYKVIPLTKLPRIQIQTPVYFSTQKFTIGQIVEVPLGKRKVFSIILSSKNAREHKIELKKTNFLLRKIEKALTTRAVLDKKFLQLAKTISDYYFEPMGLVLQRMLPASFSKPSKNTLKMFETLNLQNKINIKFKKNTLVIGKQVLIRGTGNLLLVPTYIQLANAEARMPKNTTIIKRHTTQTQLRTIWEQCSRGKIKNIAGTRLALFMPIKNLKHIIVENENSSSHVSWDQHPKLNAKYAAKIRSDLYSANLTFVDSIPSIETYLKAKKENWVIKQHTANSPTPVIIDMRKELKDGNISVLSKDLQHILINLRQNEKIFLFIVRRGLASSLLCRECGYIEKCIKCDWPLTLHANMLICHKCGQKNTPPIVCKNCGGHKIKYLGGGTEKVENEIKTLYPNLKVGRIDRDVAPIHEMQEKILNDFKIGKLNVLIGTTLGLKEYTLPELKHSAVVMLDTILNLPTYKASEEAFEIMWRIKTITKNPLIIQTYHPETYPLKYIKNDNFLAFFKEEAKLRKALSWPPYSQLIKLNYKDKNSQKAENEAKILKQKLETQLKFYNLEPRTHPLTILGPAPAFIPKVAGYYVWYMLIKWPVNEKSEVLNLEMRNKLLSIVPPRWEIIVDPIDML